MVIVQLSFCKKLLNSKFPCRVKGGAKFQCTDFEGGGKFPVRRNFRNSSAPRYLLIMTAPLTRVRCFYIYVSPQSFATWRKKVLRPTRTSNLNVYIYKWPLKLPVLFLLTARLTMWASSSNYCPVFVTQNSSIGGAILGPGRHNKDINIKGAVKISGWLISENHVHSPCNFAF